VFERWKARHTTTRPQKTRGGVGDGPGVVRCLEQAIAAKARGPGLKPLVVGVCVRSVKR
jgi:hypothetical protein